MNSRERILAMGAAGAMGLAMVVLLWTRMVSQPVAEAREASAQLVLENDTLSDKVAMGSFYYDRLTQMAAGGFGADERAASAAAREHLLAVLGKCDLGGEKLTLTPVAGRKTKGGIVFGWIISTAGTPRQVTDLLYRLRQDPRLYRVDQVSWSPSPKGAGLELKLTWLSLLVEPPQGVPREALAAAVPKAEAPDEAQRRRYDLIAARDLFRPYVKRPPPPPPPPSASPDPPPPASPQRVVALSTWNGKQEVVVRDPEAGTSRTYSLGDDLLDGELLMVDYRPLPHPERSQLLSPSRLIVRVGKVFWAVELGQDLRQKRLLKKDELPPKLVSAQEAPDDVQVTAATGERDLENQESDDAP